jgi:hypothetical protein
MEEGCAEELTNQIWIEWFLHRCYIHDAHPSKSLIHILEVRGCIKIVELQVENFWQHIQVIPELSVHLVPSYTLAICIEPLIWPSVGGCRKTIGVELSVLPPLINVDSEQIFQRDIFIVCSSCFLALFLTSTLLELS